jgi:hypothetical protein
MEITEEEKDINKINLFISSVNLLINSTLKDLFQTENDYNISIFETKYDFNSFKGITLRVSPFNSPRSEEYQGVEYITPPGTPIRDDEDTADVVQIDILCLYIKNFKLEFITKIETIIKEYFKTYVNKSIELKVHIDRLTIKFKIIHY